AVVFFFFFFSRRRRHTRSTRDWSSDVCSSDLGDLGHLHRGDARHRGRPAAGGLLLEGRDPLAGVLEPARERGAVGDGRAGRGAQIGRASCRERVWVWGGGGGWLSSVSAEWSSE